MSKLTTSLAVCALVTFSAGVRAATVIETFKTGGNEGGWTWSGPGQSVQATGGNPGHYLHIPFLDTFAPQPRTSAGSIGEFGGDYEAQGVTSLGIDLITHDVDFSAGGRPLSLMLFNDNGTPGNGGDDWGAYIVGPSNIPLPGQGWLSYDFVVPSQSGTLPTGWVMTGNVGSHTWAELRNDVDEVRYFYGDPDFVFIFQGWELGLDNPRITKDVLAGEPGRVPTDMLMARVTATGSQVRLFWSASPCAAEDYGIYEGDLGDFTSHELVTCTDLLGDLEERIVTAPGDHYYLVVPLGTTVEGSYGLDSGGTERPPSAGATCRPSQSTACP